jgi:hypothetical protein
LCGLVVPSGFYRVGKQTYQPVTASNPTLPVVALFVPHLDTINDLAFSRPPERPSAEQSVLHTQQLNLILTGPFYQERVGSFSLEIDDPPDKCGSHKKYKHLPAITHFALLDDA